MDKGPSGNATLQLPYLRVVDLQEEGEAHADEAFSNAERAAFAELARDPDIIGKVAASIAPKIRGADDIKLAIACLLFGGSRKVCARPAAGGSGSRCAHAMPRRRCVGRCVRACMAAAAGPRRACAHAPCCLRCLPCRSCQTAPRGAATSTCCCWATPRSASRSFSSSSARCGVEERSAAAAVTGELP